MKINIILHPENDSWIIEKMALKLKECVNTLGMETAISREPNAQCDINHWMSYAFAVPPKLTPSSMLITHIDDPYKLAQVKSQLSDSVDIGLCMSSYALRELVNRGLPRESLAYINPGHDSAVKPRPTVIGITTRLYDDGRKRESLIIKLSESMSLRHFEFVIFGSGWDRIVPKLERAGAIVRYIPGGNDYKHDYKIMIEEIPYFDYYLYLGLDEGSLGTLDACAAGVKTIVTPQGFHVDLADGITHPVWTFEDLLKTFKVLSNDRQKMIDSASGMNWRKHAEKHIIVWRALVAQQRPTIPTLLGQSDVFNLIENDRYVSGSEFHSRSLKPRRILSYLARKEILQPLRNALRKW